MSVVGRKIISQYCVASPSFRLTKQHFTFTQAQLHFLLVVNSQMKSHRLFKT